MSVKEHQKIVNTAEEFFNKYTRKKRKLEELEYRLARLDDDVIRTTQIKQDKVQITKQNQIDERVYNREELRERLQWDIQWLKFEIDWDEAKMQSIGNEGGYSIRYLKDYYLNNRSIHAIAKSYGVSTYKVKTTMKETEKLLCFLAK